MATTNVIIKCKADKETIKLSAKATKLHKQGTILKGNFGKHFIDFCQNTIIIM